MPRRPQKAVSRRRWDAGRIIAQLLCAVFAVVGGLPLLGGMLVRSEPIQRWAASETARVLKEQLGVTASYRVEMKLWPLQVSVHDLVVPSNDGGAPALSAKRVAVTPRVFSLLAGKLDVGDIEIDQPKGRIVLRDGKIANVSYRLPKRKGPTPKMERAPFSSLSVTDAELELERREDEDRRGADGRRRVRRSGSELRGPRAFRTFRHHAPSHEAGEGGEGL